MSQYRSTGGLDDAIASDGDKAFNSVNLRDQLNQLLPTEVRESVNGRMEGYWKPRKSVESRTGALVSGGNPLQLPFYIIDAAKSITAATVASGVVTLTTSAAHGLTGSGLARIAGLVGNAVMDGDFALTVTGANTLTYSVAGLTTISDQVGTLSQTPINDSAAGNVRASCLFSNPNEQSKEYVIVALDTVAKKIDLDTYAVTTITYPPAQTVDAFTDMIQVFDKVMLFRDGKQALEWYPNGRPIVSASQSSTTVTLNVREHGLLAGASITVAGLAHATLVPANGTFTVLAVLTKDQFTYTFTTSQTVATFDTTVATVSDGFSLSPGGAYTQPQVFVSDGTEVVVSGGLVSLTVSSNTTISAGDVIVIYESTIPEFSSIVSKEFQVTSASATNISFFAPVANIAANGSTNPVEFGGRFSVGGGFMHQPGAPWGIHFQRRLWVPYYYDQSGAYNSPTYVSRKIADEIAVSDILDTTTFDQIESQFRITGGTADFVVAMHGFYNDSLVVLNRNSLHLIQESKGGLLDVTVKELTSEIGCLARKSVVMRGNAMYFLSDNGVYGLEFLNDYNLRGMDQPLSKNIQPYIDRINPDKADKAVAVYFDNRYFLAVPLDSVAGANDAIGNNAVLVYNFLNKGWESIDTYGNNQFIITDYITASGGVRNNLYTVTSNGGLHQMEFAESIQDRLSVSNLSNDIVTPQIAASLTSRGYNFNTLERKRFTDTQIQMQNLAGETGEYNISFAAEDPDFAAAIGTTSTFLGGMLTPSTTNEAETATIRCRIGGVRGFTGTLILNRTQGSPKIHSIMVAGSVTNRQIISQK